MSGNNPSAKWRTSAGPGDDAMFATRDLRFVSGKIDSGIQSVSVKGEN